MTWPAKTFCKSLLLCTLVGWTGACGSSWKLRGGPAECLKMCEGWDMNLSGMVGVGQQGMFGDGATACVCNTKGAPGAPHAAVAAPVAATAAIAAARNAAH